MSDRTPASVYFVQAGQALYGEAWQSPLARRLGLNLRTVQRIAEAVAAETEYPVAPGVMTELVDHLNEKARDCRALADMIGRWHGG